MDMGMGTVEPFSINDVNVGNEKITYVGVSQLDITIDDKQAIVFGLDIDKSVDMKMLGADIPSLNKNEVVINQKKVYKEYKNSILFANLEKLKLPKFRIKEQIMLENTEMLILVA